MAASEPIYVCDIPARTKKKTGGIFE